MASILIIDDEAIMQKQLTGILANAGHETATADTAEEGYRLAEEMKPDLVITDIFVPEAGGLEVIRRIKKSVPKARIIAISGSDVRQEVDVLGLARSEGADETFQKPIHAQVITETINHLLSS